MSPQSRRLRGRVALAVVLLAVAALPVAIAYACNPQAHLSLDRSTYSPGQAVTAYGSYFTANSNITVSGPAGTVNVKSSSGGAFTARGLVAPSRPGTYTITASRPTGGFAPASFRVAAAQQSEPAPSSSGSSPSQQPSSSQPPSRQPAPSTQSRSFDTPSVARSQREGSSRQGSSRPSTPTRRPPSTTRPSGSTGTTRSTVTTAPAATTVVTAPSGQSVFSVPGSTVATTPPASATTVVTAGGTERSSRPAPGSRSRDRGESRSPRQPAPAAAPATPSDQAAIGDVWASYEPGRTPSLTSDGAAAVPTNGTSSQTTLAIALMAFSLLALVAGLTAAEVRRRRPA